jgi:opacity protein-like surface antigen
MKKTLLLVLVLISLITLSSRSLAQSVAIGPQLGFVKSGDADKAVIMPGLALRLNLIGVSVEGAIHYKSEDFSTSAGKVTVKTYPISLTAFVNVLPIAHAEAGIGWYNAKIDFDHPISSISDETKSKPGYHVGAGVQIPAGNILLTGDIRYVFLDLGSMVSMKTNFTVIMVGAMFKL